MFVRWKKRELELSAGYALTAVLVESRRVNGKPRQKILTTLATTRTDLSRFSEWYQRIHRTRFWSHANRNLDWLGDKITPEQRAQVESVLAERVPRLTEADMTENQAQRQELMRQMAAAGVKPEQWLMPGGSA